MLPALDLGVLHRDAHEVEFRQAATRMPEMRFSPWLSKAASGDDADMPATSGHTATVCFVTCMRWPEISASDRVVAEALERHGVAVAGVPWNATDAAFDGYDAVILRSSWDYHLTPDDFLAWLARSEARGLNLWNRPALVRWNIHKRYLLDLAAAGVAVVPSVVTDVQGVPAVLDARAWASAVVKPAVGASAHGTTLVERSEARLVERLHDVARGGELVVQPFVQEIRDGEWSLVFIDGTLTHAVLKRPASGDFRVQAAFGGTTVPATPPASVHEPAQRAVAALPAAPLYARIDGVVTPDGFLVMEAEVNEPSLFFLHAPEAAARFADAIRARL